MLLCENFVPSRCMFCERRHLDLLKFLAYFAFINEKLHYRSDRIFKASTVIRKKKDVSKLTMVDSARCRGGSRWERVMGFNEMRRQPNRRMPATHDDCDGWDQTLNSTLKPGNKRTKLLFPRINYPFPAKKPCTRS